MLVVWCLEKTRAGQLWFVANESRKVEGDFNRVHPRNASIRASVESWKIIGWNDHNLSFEVTIYRDIILWLNFFNLFVSISPFNHYLHQFSRYCSYTHTFVYDIINKRKILTSNLNANCFISHETNRCPGSHGRGIHVRIEFADSFIKPHVMNHRETLNTFDAMSIA